MTPRGTLRIAAVVAAVAVLAGCENMDERSKGTATGAAIGALGGAVLSKATGGKAGTGAVIGGVVGAVGGNLWSKRMEDKRRAMEQATAGTGIDVARTPDNQLKVNVPSDLSFAVGRSDLQPSLRPVLDQFAKGLDQTMHVRIVGHTDSTGSDAINDPLSLARARTVRDYLEDRGVPSSRLEIAGRGSREPVADNGSDAGRAKNRRVEIFLREPESPQAR
ncbi:OmpA family protein [Rubrivivax gelatinosus]|uniref:OmpA/MotB family outer membrane protein n=1 Tax=Rubrivivax gelatinosus (strain NBRC 100245 / IL144) TaxID=983917 RepID=I0HK94_RUBGI|nr:OmpA family protein [Rubrivivax gelatinosus]MBG6080052.1 outer membrane protein OmpA-like peptidoglycan-associated protein [Rubrivivax gelatinosus]BAL93431.1 OmpA/MotB family outer membrane protein [Rubrivivax gelatinosus IL144]